VVQCPDIRKTDVLYPQEQHCSEGKEDQSPDA